MAFKRYKPSGGNIFTRVINRFSGSHYGVGKTDQPDEYSQTQNFDYFNDKPEVREGKTKNQQSGFPASINGMILIRIFGKDLLGIVNGDTLSITPVTDILTAIGQPVTWGELRGKGTTWNELKVAPTTWGDLKRGRRTWES